MRIQWFGSARFLTGVWVAGVALAGVAVAAEYRDMQGGRDHPSISRFEGSVLLNQKTEPYAPIDVALGNIIVDPKLRDFAPEKRQSVEGKISSYFYVAPTSTSSLEVFRNYQSALSAAGFTTLYTCERKQCGNSNSHGVYYTALAGFSSGPNPHNSFVSVDDTYFLSAKKSSGGQDIYVMVTTSDYGSNFDDRAAILQVVVEPRPVKLGAVKVDAAALGQTLANEGRVALYGLYFDTDSAVVKTESRPQLEEIAKFLKANPTIQVLVVGHTDNQGSFEHNLTLSQQRADSVVRELVKNHQVPANRLLARGNGSTSPVASNRAEDGRARNRRVEIVER